jgi:branched-chain amino acid transport system substrate-binding protein
MCCSPAPELASPVANPQRQRRREGSVAAAIVGWLAVAVMAAVLAAPAGGQAKYDLGASALEIRIGSVMPYSGPMAAYGAIGRTEAAYFEKINSGGGINRRKIQLISYDDGFDPPTTLKAAQQLVERDEVLLVFQSLGAGPSAAIEKYLNQKKIPQLFVASGAARFGDPAHFPWTIGWQPSWETEGRIYARFLLDSRPTGKIGVLRDDEAGKEYLKGLKDGLAGRMPLVLPPSDAEDASIAAQVGALKAAEADILFIAEPPDVTAQALAAVAEIDWKPLVVVVSMSASADAVLKSAGPDNAQGILSAAYMKSGSDFAWQTDTARLEWGAFMDKYYPDGDQASDLTAYGYLLAQTLVQVLKQCGDDLTRDNVMHQATHLKKLQLGMLLPGILINTASDNYLPIRQMQMERFGGEDWHPFGPVLSADPGG